jgi:hypothetical protein
MSIVNTFIVGMPKAGTTSLHRYLSEHPDTCMAEDKEPHYFSVDLLKEGAEFHGHPKYTRYPTLEAYHELFAERGAASVVGESSVFYLFSKAAAQSIYDYNPDAKIIILLREPVAFLYSLHSQGLYSGNETEKDFRKALDLETVRRQGKQLPSTVHFPSRLYYRDHWKVAEQIERFVEVFGQERIKVIVFDAFKSNTEQEVLGVMDFLGLDSTFLPNLVNHNANTAMRSQRLARVIQDPNHPITFMAKRLLPKRMWKQGKVLLKKINTDHSPRARLDLELQQKLRQEAGPHVQELQNYLQDTGLNQTDLMTLWGYSVDN